MKRKSKWGKCLSLGTAGLFLLTVMVSTRVQAAPTVIIPYLATGYKYKVVPFDDELGFEQPSFDDSGFSTGDAGFGSPSGCPLNNPTDVKTDWPTNTDILLRKQFNLPSGASNLQVGVAIDNDVQVFINGQDISGGLVEHEGCPERDSFIFTAPDGILKVGTNLVAVRGRDRGVIDYVDVRVTTGGVPDLVEVPVDIKPMGCPNPLNVKSKGVLPVAILGTATFDVTQVNVSTVKLEGVATVRNALGDVATPFVPFTGKTSANDCTAAGPDGLQDRTLKFDVQSVIATLGSVTSGEVRVLKLTGELTDGTPIRGEDVVVIIVE